MENENQGPTVLGLSLMFLIIALILCGCTLSMSNISTHGQASDVLDEQQEASPDISPTLSLPAI